MPALIYANVGLFGCNFLYFNNLENGYSRSMQPDRKPLYAERLSGKKSRKIKGNRDAGSLSLDEFRGVFAGFLLSN